jgi:hypothetical protein
MQLHLFFVLPFFPNLPEVLSLRACQVPPHCAAHSGLHATATWFRISTWYSIFLSFLTAVLVAAATMLCCAFQFKQDKLLLFYELLSQLCICCCISPQLVGEVSFS